MHDQTECVLMGVDGLYMFNWKVNSLKKVMYQINYLFPADNKSWIFSPSKYCFLIFWKKYVMQKILCWWIICIFIKNSPVPKRIVSDLSDVSSPATASIEM